MSEKALLPPGSPADRARARSSTWSMGEALVRVTMAIFLCGWIVAPTLLGGPPFRFDIGFSRSSRGLPPSGEDRCPQPSPLWPRGNSSSLSEMDSWMRTAEFRAQSVAKLSGAVQVRTESFDDMGTPDEDPRWGAMVDFAAYLARTFPLVHASPNEGGRISLEKVNTHALLYTWAGSDPSLKPTVLLAHQDVVPVVEATIDQWTHPPWSGHYDGRYVWGRGASDCKNTLIAILEAIEALLAAGFQPRRTIVLAFGFDEELSGPRGAGHLAPLLVERYGKDGAAVLVDEGAGVYPVWGSNFAVPGVVEKGYVDIEVVVRMPGGHSSVPPPHTGIGVMAELIREIEAAPYEPRLVEYNPFLALTRCGAAYGTEFPETLRKRLDERDSKRGEGGFLSCMTRHGKRDDHGRDPLALEAAKMGDMVKYLFTTSVATDVIRGGVKVNALPERTTLLVNHRVNVGETTEGVWRRFAAIAAEVAARHNLTLNALSHGASSVSGEGDDAEQPNSITLRTDGHTLETSPLTPTALKPDEGSSENTTAWAVLSGTTLALYGQEEPDEKLYMAPGIMTANTDTRYYWDLTRNIFRFVPGWDPAETNFLSGVHTVNERISVTAHIHAVQWFSLFVRNMDEAELA